MKLQQYSSRELGQTDEKVRDHGVVETGSVGQGNTDHHEVDPHMPGHSSDRHTVHHKHRSDRCNVGWQKEGRRRKVHHRDEFHKGDQRRDAHHKDDRRRNDWRTDHRGARRTAVLGKDCMAGHNKDRHRAEKNDGGNRIHLVVSLGWTGLVCTL